MLRSLDEVTDGGPVTELQHALQVATWAQRAGADEDLVLGALLHDVAKVFGDEGHGPMAAALLEPHLRPEVVEVVRHHSSFTARHWQQLGPDDDDPRDAFADREWYPLACTFVDEWDMQSFDPEATPEPLEAFEPMIRRRLTGP